MLHHVNISGKKGFTVKHVYYLCSYCKDKGTIGTEQVYECK